MPSIRAPPNLAPPLALITNGGRDIHPTPTNQKWKKIMAQRITMPNGNSHSSFVMASIKLYEGKGVVCLDARGKPLEWIPIEDMVKARRVRDMLTGALNGERRYRTLDWSFLTEPLPQAPSQAVPTPKPTSAPTSEPDPVPAAITKPKASK